VVRSVLPTVIGWWVAIAVTALLFGLIARSAGATVQGSSVRQVLEKLGAPGAGTEAVLGVCFLTLAILLAFVTAGQLTAARSEESTGRLDHLLARPVSRSSWLIGRLLVAVVVLVTGGLLAGASAWLGAASQHSGVGLTTLLGAGLNLVPPSITILGIGALAFGLVPRITSIVVYALLIWSLLVVVVGGFGPTSRWALDTSVFHYMASAPSVPPHWGANAAMVTIGVAAAVLGGLAFRRRDLEGD
jgi:ABC-2 type transport system permease protein